MLPAPIDQSTPHRGTRAHRAYRRRLTWLSVLATLVAGLVTAGVAPPARAAQASGDDVAAWNTGWSWTYATTFRYVAEGTNVTLNQNVTYTVAGVETFQGQSAYRLNITGTITGGSGSAAVDGVGNANLSNFAGSVTGTKFVRRSDLAMLQETQNHNLTGRAQVSIISQNITATINLQMTPQRAWRALVFPLEAGQSWSNDVDVAYTGGFAYSAGSLASGESTFDGVFEFNDPSTVTNANITVPAGAVGARRVHAQSADGSTVNTHWWSPNHRNDAQELLKLPIDGGELELERKLASASVPAASTTLTNTITPSLSCAGGDVTVSGRLSSGAAGVPVSVVLDKSPATVGATVTASTTTTAGGNYSATIAAPAESDGLAKTGARASWGVLTSAGGATAAGTLVVTGKNCSTLAYTGDTGAAQGTDATVRAVLTDRAGGNVAGRTVTFALSGGATVTATTDANGVAQTQIAVAGPPRNATLTASYAGDGGLEPAGTSTGFVVGTVPTTTSVVADPPVVTIGDPVRFTATVDPQHGATPTGTVQFRVDNADFGSPVALSGGTATSPALSTLGLGNHTVTAIYSGSADHTASTSQAVTFRVRQPLLGTTTTSSLDASSVVFGQPVTLSANVAPSTGTGTPTGEVVFTSGGTELARAGLAPDGSAAVTVSDLPVGSLQVVATYAGDDAYAASAASPRNLSVAKAAVDVELASSATGPTVSGEAISYTATVAVQAPGGGTPGGTVQLLVDGNEVGAPVALTGGSAAFPPLTTLSAGTHTVEARYAGTATHGAGSDSVQQEVAQADTTTAVTATPSPSVEEQNIQFTAVVAAVAPGSGAPTGTVTFYADGDALGSAPLTATSSGSTATLDVSDLAPGSYQVTARFGGDADYRASNSAAISHTVIEGAAIVETTTALTSSANPSTYGELITFRAEVAGGDAVPTGTVQFSVDGQDFGDPVAVDGDGVAESATLASPDPGDHTVIARFVGDVGFAGSGDILVQTVEAAGVDVTLTSSSPEAQVDEDVRFSVEVGSQAAGTGTPTGFVQFSVDGRPLGDAVELVDGAAASPLATDLAPGDHTVTALYSGDVHFRSATAEITQKVVRIGTSTALSLSRSSSVYGDAVTLTATVTPADDRLGAPTGPVTFTANGQVVATGTLAPAAGGTGVATATVATLPAGEHTLRAVYDGDQVFEGSSSATRPLSVAKRATVVTPAAAVVSLSPLGLPLGQLRAAVTAGGQPLAGVPVEFRVGNKLVCTSTTESTGVAVCNAASQLLALVLNGGYTATYGGDANHLSSTARGAILK